MIESVKTEEPKLKSALQRFLKKSKTKEISTPVFKEDKYAVTLANFAREE